MLWQLNYFLLEEFHFVYVYINWRFHYDSNSHLMSTSSVLNRNVGKLLDSIATYAFSSTFMS